MSRHEEVMAAATGAVGPVTLVAEHCWGLGEAVVIELSTAAGSRVVAKGHTERLRFEREVEAYHRWVPGIADRAPHLLAVNDELGVIVIEHVDGIAPPTRFDDPALERRVHRGAAQVLRRFHDVQTAQALPGWAEARISGLEAWIARAPEGLLDPRDIAVARQQVAQLAQFPEPLGVPCHGDWQPRNWIIVANGNVFTFDFERAGVAWWCHDLQRLWWREWADRPDLAHSHFEGYGRAPTEQEIAMLMATSAAGHISQIVWATERHDVEFARDGRRYLRDMQASHRDLASLLRHSGRSVSRRRSPSAGSADPGAFLTRRDDETIP